MTETKKRKIALAIYDIDASDKGPAYQMLHIYIAKHSWQRWGSPALAHVMTEIFDPDENGGRTEVLVDITPSAIRGEDVWKVGGKPEMKLIQVRLPSEFDYPTFGKEETWAYITDRGTLSVEWIAPEPEQEPETGGSSGEDVAAVEPASTDPLPYGDDPPNPPKRGKNPLWAIVCKLDQLTAGLAAGSEAASGGMPQVERDALFIADLKDRADHRVAIEERETERTDMVTREVIAFESISKSLQSLDAKFARVLEYGMPLDTTGLKDA